MNKKEKIQQAIAFFSLILIVTECVVAYILSTPTIMILIIPTWMAGVAALVEDKKLGVN